MEFGGAAFALGTLLSLSRTLFAFLGPPCVPLGYCRLFRRAFAFLFSLGILLRRLDGMGLGFLSVSPNLAAKPLALPLALPAPVLGRSSAREQQDRDHDHDTHD